MATVEAEATRTETVPLITSKTVIRAVEALVGAIVFVVLIQYVLRFSLFDPDLWSGATLRQANYWPRFVDGTKTSLFYISLTLPISVAIGFFLGWARVARFKAFSWPVAVYVDFFRGVPPLVIIIFASLLGPKLLPPRFITPDTPLLMGALALAMHSGAYQAEIFRAGFQSVSRGQLEAAQALGMRPGQAMQSVVLPQALRLSLPPLGNEFAVLIKDTSLLYVIGAFDLFGWSLLTGQTIAIDVGRLELLFTMWTSVALVYFVLTFAVTRVMLLVERRFHARGLEALSI